MPAYTILLIPLVRKSRVLDNLSRFPFLETLVISAGHKVKDMAPVGRLMALRSLDMPGNLISNLAPLEPCLLLQRVNVEDNQIANVPSFFTGMIMIKTFLLAKNKVTDREAVGVLSNMPALTEVRGWDLSWRIRTSIPHHTVPSIPCYRIFHAAGHAHLHVP